MRQDSTLWTRDFILIILTNLLIFFGFEMMVTILPLYFAAHGGSDTVIGAATMLFTAAALVTRALAGSWLDRFGRKAVFLIGMAAMTLVTGIYPLASAVAVIILIRIVHGFTWGVTSTSSDTVGSDTVPKARFGEGMGYLGLSNSLGMAAGPAFGLFLLQKSSFPAAFLSSAGLLLLALLAFLQMKSVKTKEDIRLAMAARQGRDSERTLLERNALLPAAAVGLAGTSYGALVSFLALYGEQEGIENIGIYFAVYAAAMLVTRPLAGRMTDRKGHLHVVLPGLCLIVAGLCILSEAHTLPVFFLSAAFYGSGMGASMSALQAMAVRNAPPDRIGASNATFLIGFDSGIGIGSLISGLLAARWGYGNMYRFFVIFVLCAFFLLLVRRKRETTASS